MHFHKRAGARAVGAEKRSIDLPDVPTMAEAGLPYAAYHFSGGIFMSAKTPLKVIRKLQHETAKALEVPKVRERLAKTATEPMPMSTSANISRMSGFDREACQGMSASRRTNTGNYAPPGPFGTSVASSSHASLALQVCSSPQSGHRIRPATSGKRLNTDGSVSISVETARPERGQRIITAPMATLPRSQTVCAIGLP
jgi:hypothetical protein